MKRHAQQDCIDGYRAHLDREIMRQRRERPATTTTETVRGEPHFQRRLPEGVRVTVVPATNLPEDSWIKWWLVGFDPGNMDRDRFTDICRIRDSIGWGFSDSDLDIES